MSEADSIANLILKFGSTGYADLMKQIEVAKAGGVDLLKQQEKRLQIEKERARAERVASQVTLEQTRQQTVAMRNSIREQALAFKTLEAARRNDIALATQQHAANARLAAGIRGIGSSGAFGPSALGRLGVAGAVAYAGVRIGTDMVQEAAKWERMNLAIAQMEKTGERTKRTLEDLYQIAKAPAIDLATAQHAYIQLRAAGMEGERAKKVITEVSNAIARGGGGSTEFERFNRQLTQMLTNGKVLQTDLKWMKESMPMLATFMENAFGQQNAEGIRKMHIGAEAFLTGILAEMEKLGPATQTLTSEIENSGVAWSKFKASFVDTEFVKSSLGMWTSMLEDMTRSMEKSTFDWMRLIGDIGFVTLAPTFENIKAVAGRVTSGAYKTKQVTFDEYVAEEAKGYDISEEESKKGHIKPNADGTYTIPVSDERAKEAEKARKEAERRRNEAFRKESEINRQIQEAFNKAVRADVDKENEKKKKDAEENLALEQRIWERRISQYGNFVDLERDINEAAYDVMNEQREEQLQLVTDAKDRWFKSDLDRTKEHYEKLNEAILNSTEKGSKEQIELLKRAAFERDLAAATSVMNASAQMASGASSMFGDFANAYKMGSDYRYEAEKRNIEKTMSLAGLEGKARVQMQRKRDEALAQLDEKRQSEMAGAYHTMFMISKGFALAESVLKLNLAIANAAASGPFPANLAAMGAVAGAVGSVVSNIATINYAGAFNKGGDIPEGSYGIVGDGGPELVRGPAKVTSVADTAKMMRPTVNIHNYAGASVQATPSADGSSIDIVINQIAEKVEDRLSTGVRSGRGGLNSAIKESYGLTRRA
jgi:tape measure domain-containing protein